MNNRWFVELSRELVLTENAVKRLAEVIKTAFDSDLQETCRQIRTIGLLWADGLELKVEGPDQVTNGAWCGWCKGFTAMDDATDSVACIWCGGAVFCCWQQGVEDGAWGGSCGILWSFEGDHPREHKINYCPQCGKRVKAIIARDDWEEE